MESLLINVHTKKDIKLLNEIARKMGFSTRVINDEEKEELGLLKAMEEGRKSKPVSRDVIMKNLDRK